MATHYKLVACYKNKYSFINEEELSEMFDHPITSLEEIDRVTCRYPDDSYLINLLDRDGIISGKNHLSIKYRKKDKDCYLHPIFGVPELIDVIDDLQVVKTFRDSRPINYKIVSHKNLFYQDKLKEFYSFIDNNPEYFFTEIYGDNFPKRLFHLVKIYTDFKRKDFDTLDDEYEFNDKKREMELEFSRYKTFRGYLVYLKKYMEKNNINTNVEVSTHIIRDYNIGNSNTDVIGEVEFSDEEFLTREEIESSVGDEDDWYRGPRCR